MLFAAADNLAAFYFIFSLFTTSFLLDCSVCGQPQLDSWWSACRGPPRTNPGPEVSATLQQRSNFAQGNVPCVRKATKRRVCILALHENRTDNTSSPKTRNSFTTVTSPTHLPLYSPGLLSLPHLYTPRPTWRVYPGGAIPPGPEERGEGWVMEGGREWKGRRGSSAPPSSHNSTAAPYYSGPQVFYCLLLVIKFPLVGVGAGWWG